MVYLVSGNLNQFESRSVWGNVLCVFFVGLVDMDSNNFGSFSLEEDDYNKVFITQTPKENNGDEDNSGEFEDKDEGNWFFCHYSPKESEFGVNTGSSSGVCFGQYSDISESF